MRFAALAACLLSLAAGEAPQARADGIPTPSCPPGARPRGSAPPGGHSLRCERADGTPDGPAFSWYGNGKPRRQGAYRGGEMWGEWKRWYPNGRIRDEGRWNAGAPEGIWTFWDESGNVVRTRSYADTREAPAEGERGDPRARSLAVSWEAGLAYTPAYVLLSRNTGGLGAAGGGVLLGLGIGPLFGLEARVMYQTLPFSALAPAYADFSIQATFYPFARRILGLGAGAYYGLLVSGTPGVLPRNDGVAMGLSTEFPLALALSAFLELDYRLALANANSSGQTNLDLALALAGFRYRL